MAGKNIQLPPLKMLQFLHKAMLIAMLLFAAVAFYLIYSNTFEPTLQQYDKVLQVVAIALSFGGFFIGSALLKKCIQSVKDNSESAEVKIASYRAVTIIQWALIEGPCLFALICFLLTGNLSFFLLAALFIILFAVTGPNRLKIMLLLQLSEEEMDRVL